ncbi:hypothetical protein AKO1_007697 [Acrasis kona]|uniref:N-acetyltransferase domain-containing protein n=1 Tax=Acrasis kona TaxID=1008807 RepID=A0AAW2YRB4_9EUKA
MSKALESNNDFELHIMEDAHAEQAIEILSQSFSQREPLTVGILTAEQARVFMEHCVRELALKEKVSLVIVEKNTNKVVHALINFDNLTENNFDISKMPPKWASIGNALETLGAKYRSTSQNVRKGEVLHLWMAATREGYEGRGFLMWSGGVLLKVAKNAGFKEIVIEATANGTHHIFANKLGFTINNTIIPCELFPNEFGHLKDHKCTYLVGKL